MDYCERCGGVWLDAGELEALLGDCDDALRKLLSQTGRPARTVRSLCPRCDAKLHEFDVKGIVLDRCPQGHGLWFDAGELPQLASLYGDSKAVGFLQEVFRTKPTIETEESKS